MKRTALVLLAMVMSLSACGGTDTAKINDEDAQTQSQTDAAGTNSADKEARAEERREARSERARERRRKARQARLARIERRVEARQERRRKQRQRERDQAAASTPDCTDGYDPCLTPASDYDCAGGSGDGPEYTGYVTVTGSDPYDLDSDGDGAGCES